MQVREVVASVEDQQRASTAEPLQEAKVTAVQQMPMGERVCVDLCSRLSPGEGLLVGNFCRTLFLVHSEVRARALTLRCALCCYSHGRRSLRSCLAGLQYTP